MAETKHREPMPVLLSKVEALEYAARSLELNAQGIELASLILGSIKKTPLSEPLAPDMQADLDRFRAGIVDVDLQLTAMKAAAAAIRELALEERLISARAMRAEGVKA